MNGCDTRPTRIIRTAIVPGRILAGGLGLAAPAGAQDIRIARRNGHVDADDIDRRGPRFVVRGSDRPGDVVDVRRR